MPLTYCIWLLGEDMYLYKTPDGLEWFPFQTLIQIVPHDLCILCVMCRYENNKGIIREHVLYGEDEDVWYSTIPIVKEVANVISEDWKCNQSDRDELFHLIDLWFTKFVPYNRVICNADDDDNYDDNYDDYDNHDDN